VPPAIKGQPFRQMSESKITPSVIYKAILLAFALVIGAMIFRALSSLILGLLIVVIVATPLSAFADFLGRWHCPRAIGANPRTAVGLGGDRRTGGADRPRLHAMR
jgi:hypothetical protein